MSTPPIHGKRPVYSASAALQAIGRALSEIKHEDSLTWADIGAVLGKSEDQAAKYADGTAAMDAVTYGRGKQYWNGRFTGYFDRLCVDSRPGVQCDRSTVTAVLSAVTALNAALEDDDAVSETEVRDNRKQLEAARDALDHHLAKIRLGAVA